MKLGFILFLVFLIIVLVLVLVVIIENEKLKKFEENLEKTEAEIIQRKQYEEGVKKDNEELSKVSSGNKLSNFKSGLDLLRK